MFLFSFFTGKVIPNDRVHPRLWKGSNRKFRFIPWQKNEIKKQNKVSAIVQTNRTAIPSKVSSLMIKKSTSQRQRNANMGSEQTSLLLVFFYFPNIELKAIIGLVINPSGGAVAS